MWVRWAGDIDCRGNGGEGSLAARIATLARCAICTAEAMAEHFDVLIVGAGISGIGGGYHLTHQCPGTSFVILEAQDELRRHLAHPPLSRHPLRHRPLHLRLPLQALDRAADRDRGGDPQVSRRGDRRERSRPAHPLPAPDRARALVERARAAGPSTRGGPTRAKRSASPPTSCGCARATTGMPKATRRSGRAWSGSRGRSSIRRPGPRTWTTAAGASWSSAPAPRRPPSSRRWPTSVGHVTMLQRSPTWYRTARNAIPIADELRELQVDESWIHEIVRRKILYEIGQVHPPHLHRAGQGGGRVAWRRARTCSARTTTSPATSRRATGPGASGSPSFPTATCSTPSPRARRRS